jgi:hypothetical protein
MTTKPQTGHIHPVPGLLMLTVVLTQRFLATFRRATNLNIELEERVQEKHAELEINFERMRDLEEIRVVAIERERIMREMHDGVGGHLVSILAMVEKGRGAPWRFTTTPTATTCDSWSNRADPTRRHRSGTNPSTIFATRFP